MKAVNSHNVTGVSAHDPFESSRVFTVRSRAQGLVKVCVTEGDCGS